jgi:hypothetical protein
MIGVGDERKVELERVGELLARLIENNAGAFSLRR